MIQSSFSCRCLCFVSVSFLVSRVDLRYPACRQLCFPLELWQVMLEVYLDDISPCAYLPPSLDCYFELMLSNHVGPRLLACQP